MLRAYKQTTIDVITGKLKRDKQSFASQPSEIRREHLLHNLLDEARILDQVETFEEQHTGLKLSSKGIGTSINSVLQKLFPFIEEQNNLSDWLRILPLNIYNYTQPQTGSVDMSFQRARQVINFLPELVGAYSSTTIVASLLRWQYCRCILVLYQFLSSDLPHLATILFSGHQSFLPLSATEPSPDANPEGDKWLHRHYPQYAPLVLHILEYVKTWVQSQRKSYRKKKQLPSLPSGYNLVPSDLFGLRQNKGPPIELPELMKSIHYGPGPRYEAACKCFIKLIEDTIILPTLPDADSHFNERRARSGSDLGAIRARCIVRGAILQCIVQDMQTEAICASEHMRVLLQSPSLIFYEQSVNETRISPFVLAHKPEFVAPLRRWLKKHVTPESRAAAIRLGNFFQRCSLEIQFNRELSYEQFFNSVSPEQIRSKNAKAATNHGPGPRLTPTLSSLLHNLDPPHYGGPLLLIDEAFLKATNKPANRSQARLFLDGHHYGEGKKHHSHGDPDQVNPIREFNIAAGLLRTKVPPHKLTTKKGISAS